MDFVRRLLNIPPHRRAALSGGPEQPSCDWGGLARPPLRWLAAEVFQQTLRRLLHPSAARGTRPLANASSPGPSRLPARGDGDERAAAGSAQPPLPGPRNNRPGGLPSGHRSTGRPERRWPLWLGFQGFLRPQQGDSLRLGLRNLYILPTRFGWAWLAGLLVLQVVGIQMQTNGPLLLSYLMLGLFLLALNLTHFNLQGLMLAVADPQPGFAGGSLLYPLRLRNRSRCEGLQLGFGGDPLLAVPVLPPGEHLLPVPWTPGGRGLQRPGCLRLQTTAPLGLFVCWSHWQPAVAQLVYPARIAGPVRRLNEPGTPLASLAAASSDRLEGCEEWRELRPHRPEDGASRLVWKLLARGRGRYAKRFSDPGEPLPAVLALDPCLPLERGLEHLCECICRLHGQGQAYGLVLPDGTISAGSGPAQRHRSLAALALCQGDPTAHGASPPHGP